MNGNYTDAVILAGTRHTLLVSQGGEQVPKPYLELHHEPLVHYVCRVLAEVPSLGRLVVVGEKARLEKIFSGADEKLKERIALVEEGQGILDNLWQAFSRCLLPARGIETPALEISRLAELAQQLPKVDHLRRLSALVVASDLPFVSPADVEAFIEGVHPDSALAVGLVDYRALDELAQRLGEDFPLDSWKLGAMPLGECPVRLSNLFFVRPFMADARLYPLLDEIYENRRLLTADGRVNSSSWYSIARSSLRYCWRINPWWRFVRGMLNLVPAMLAAALARSTMKKAPVLSRAGRLFLSRQDVEFIGSLLIGARGQLVINQRVGAALDIDVEEIFRFLQKRENFQRIASLLGQPGQTFCGGAGG